jgi:hypothetical protein
MSIRKPWACERNALYSACERVCPEHENNTSCRSESPARSGLPNGSDVSQRGSAPHVARVMSVLALQLVRTATAARSRTPSRLGMSATPTSCYQHPWRLALEPVPRCGLAMAERLARPPEGPGLKDTKEFMLCP